MCLIMKKDAQNNINNENYEKNIGYEIGKTSSFIRVAVMKHLKDAGITDITHEQFGILFILSQQDGLYQRQIAILLSKDRPNISRMLDILETKGYIIREKHPENKRISKVYITEKGKDKVELLIPFRDSFKEKLCKNISQEEMDICFSVLARIRENLSDSCNLQI